MTKSNIHTIENTEQRKRNQCFLCQWVLLLVDPVISGEFVVSGICLDVISLKFLNR
jgi:hypothetical protein